MVRFLFLEIFNLLRAICQLSIELLHLNLILFKSGLKLLVISSFSLRILDEAHKLIKFAFASLFLLLMVVDLSTDQVDFLLG